MSNRRNAKFVQGPISHFDGAREYQRLEDQIFLAKGVTCSVLVKPEVISIRAASYMDYVLARSAIKDSVSLPIVRSE